MVREDILVKLRRYCDYQDRCHQDVRRKLLSLQVYGDELEEAMAILIEEDLLNEERFARNFARGRHRIKGWARHRIRRELKLRQISDYCIRKAMEEIEETEYRQQLLQLLHRRSMHHPADWPTGKRIEDLREHAMRWGYELPLIEEVSRDVLEN